MANPKSSHEVWSARVREVFKGLAIQDVSQFEATGSNRAIQIFVSRESFSEALSQLRRSSNELGLSFFEDLFAMEFQGGLLVTAKWTDTSQFGRSLWLRVVLPVTGTGELTELPSLAQFWPAAIGSELEIEVLFGIQFLNRPDFGSDFSLDHDHDHFGFPMRRLGSSTEKAEQQ